MDAQLKRSCQHQLTEHQISWVCASESAKKWKGLDANRLKLIAIFAMVLQHIAIGFMPDSNAAYAILLNVGRITAPVMCFFVAEGYRHTSDLRSYLRRMLVGALVSHIPYALFFGTSVVAFWRSTSIMWSLFLALCALAVYHKTTWRPWLRLLVIGLCCVLSYPGNFNVIVVLWVLAFDVFYDRPAQKWLAYTAISFLWLAEYWIVDTAGTPWGRLSVLLAIPLLLCYDHKQGYKNKVIQRSYYLFYPAHFLILCLFRALVQ